MPKLLWQPGQSGNPKGRPPKHRALTALLKAAGNRTLEVDGERISGKRLIARMLWEAATKGKVKFPDGRELTIIFDDWLGIVKMIFGQIDGPPKQDVEVSGPDRAPIKSETKVTHDIDATGVAAILDILAESGVIALPPDASDPPAIDQVHST